MKMIVRKITRPKDWAPAYLVVGLSLFLPEIGDNFARAESVNALPKDDLREMVLLAGTEVDARVLRAIRGASETTGVALPYLLAKAYRESGFDIHADASASSASGIFQFTRQTWLELFRRYGRVYGYEELVPIIRRSSRGYLFVPKTSEGRSILNLRHDPVLAAQLAAEYTRENHDVLRRALKRPVSPEELYVAHFMGAQGAIQLLKAAEQRPSVVAAKIFPDAAASNPNLFYRYPGKKAISVSALLRRLVRSFRRELVRFSSSHTGYQMTVLPKHTVAPLRQVPRKPDPLDAFPTHKLSPQELRETISRGLMPAGGAALPWIHVMLDGRDPVRAKNAEHHHEFRRATVLEALEPVYIPELLPEGPSIAASGWTEQSTVIPPKVRDILPPIIAKAALYNAKRTYQWVTADRISAKMPSLGTKVAGGEMPRYDMPHEDIKTMPPLGQDIMVKQVSFSDNSHIEGSEAP